MITHKIKAPSLLTRVIDSFRSGMSPHSYPQQQIERRPAIPKPGFDKRRFALYIENVRQNFKIGDRITYASIPVVQGELPSALYELIYIQELWYDVEFDETIQEPRVLLLRNMNYTLQTHVSVASSRMRHLTLMESSLVDLRNKSVQGSA